MKIYKICCEWDMPIANGYFTTKEKAQKAINEEDWSIADSILDEVQENGWVSIEEIECK